MKGGGNVIDKEGNKCKKFVMTEEFGCCGGEMEIFKRGKLEYNRYIRKSRNRKKETECH